MANFRRRSRFRRELIEKQPQESLTFTSLGSRLASFKYQPDPDLECKYRLENTKPIFIGACTKCTLHSSSTFLKESLSNFAQMQNSLQEDEGRTEPSKASLPLAEIDFQREISNHRYVRALKAKKNRNIDESLQKAIALNTSFQWEECDSWTYRIAQWFRRRILCWLFPQGILYHPGQLEVLERCAVSQTPFLFLPVHKSALDLLLVKQALSKTKNRMDQKILLASTIPAEVSSQPGLQLQSHQDFAKDEPWAVQQSVVESIFKAKGHFLTFLESLDQPQVHRPKLATLDTSLLDHALQCIYDNIVQDIQIVPVGISYEEGQDPLPLWPYGFIQYFKVLLGIGGPSSSMARVDFDQPFSLKEFSDYYTNKEYDHENVKMTLAHHVLCTSWHTSRIMISNLRSFLRFYCHGYHHQSADKIIEEIYGKRRFFFKQNQLDLIKPSEYDRLDLSYPVSSIYAAESVCLIALVSLIQIPLRAFQNTNANVTVKREELVQRGLAAFDLLSYEDYFSLPCIDMSDVLERAIDALKLKEIIFIKEETVSENFQEQWARRMARNLEQDMIEENELMEYKNEILYNVSLRSESIDAMTFYIGIYGPILRKYYQVIRYLDTYSLEDHIQVSKVVSDTGSKDDDIQRILSRLLDMSAIYYCDDNYTSIQKAVESFHSLKTEVRKYLVEI